MVIYCLYVMICFTMFLNSLSVCVGIANTKVMVRIFRSHHNLCLHNYILTVRAVRNSLGSVVIQFTSPMQRAANLFLLGWKCFC